MENENLFMSIVIMLLALSEVLGYSDKIKANGVFQLIISILKKIAGK